MRDEVETRGKDTAVYTWAPTTRLQREKGEQAKLAFNAAVKPELEDLLTELDKHFEVVDDEK